MRTSHAILLRLRHDPQYDFSKASVEYVNRGAPGDRSTVQGTRILKLEQGGMEIESEQGRRSFHITAFAEYPMVAKQCGHMTEFLLFGVYIIGIQSVIAVK